MKRPIIPWKDDLVKPVTWAVRDFFSPRNLIGMAAQLPLRHRKAYEPGNRFNRSIRPSGATSGSPIPPPATETSKSLEWSAYLRTMRSSFRWAGLPFNNCPVRVLYAHTPSFRRGPDDQWHQRHCSQHSPTVSTLTIISNFGLPIQLCPTTHFQ